MARRVFRLGFFVVLALLVVLSVVPPAERPQTGVPHALEHVGAFALAGLLFGLAYAGGWLWRAGVLVVLAGGIELAQIFVPGRHARLSDLVTDTGGALLGLALGLLLQRARG